MAEPKALVGIHIKKEKRGSLDAAMEADIDMYDIGCAQVYTHGPQSLSRNKYDAEEVKQIVDDRKLSLVVHSAYMVSPWKKNKFMVKCLIQELLDAQEIGAKWLILHLPTKHAHADILRALSRIRKAITKLDDDDRARILQVILTLEHKAHKPYDDDDHDLGFVDSVSAANFIELLKEKKFTPDAPVLRVGFCLDTAHMFVSVENRSLTTESSMQDYLAPLLPHLDMIKVIHFNGSYNKYGSGCDKHSIPFSKDDAIWKKNDTGALHLLRTISAYDPATPFIIEWNLGTPHEMKTCLKKLRKLNVAA